MKIRVTSGKHCQIIFIGNVPEVISLVTSLQTNMHGFGYSGYSHRPGLHFTFGFQRMKDWHQPRNYLCVPGIVHSLLINLWALIEGGMTLERSKRKIWNWI